MTALPVSNLPVSFDPYVRQGWHLVPIPQGTKGPRNQGWNLKENTITDPNRIPAGYGVGIAHAYSGTMALDIDQWDIATQELAERGINLQALYDAPDAVTILSGKPGHGKLLYSMPFGLALTSKKINRDGKAALEFRCATSTNLTVQDVLPPSIHPETCLPYQWGGRGNWQRLPTIPFELLTFWQSLIEQDNIRNIEVTGSVSASWDEIKQAMEHLDPDMGRSDWLSIGMALHYAGETTEQNNSALLLWDEWSSHGSKYKGQQDILTCWKSFKATEDGIKLGTLFKLAHEAGYSRPIPDASHLFTSIPLSPDYVIDGLSVSPPDLDLSLIPPILARRAEELSNQIGSDPIVSVFAGYAAISAAADARIRLELKNGYKVPPVLWMMTLGDPAEKKSPASIPLFEILEIIEREHVPVYQQQVIEWEMNESAHVASKKANLLAAADPTNLIGGQLNIANLPLVHPLPAKPIPLRFLISDITSQKMVRMAFDRPYGMLCHLDEMKAWADKVTDRMSGEDRSCWTTAYEARPYRMDRVGDGKGTGSTICDNFAVGIYGNMQPEVFRTKVGALAEDGLMARFIPAALRPRFTRKGQDIPDNLTNKLEYENMIRAIHGMPAMTYRLSDGAYKAFDDFQTWYEELKHDERILKPSNHYMKAFGKLEGTTGRMMLINHLASDLYSPFISEETAITTINMVKQFIIPSFRYVYDDVGTVFGSLERWVAEHIIQLDCPTITLSELRRSATRRLPEGESSWRIDQILRDIMTGLEQASWISVLRSDGKTIQWAINPEISRIYASRRQAVIDARRRRDEMRIEKTRENIAKGEAMGRPFRPLTKILPGTGPG